MAVEPLDTSVWRFSDFPTVVETGDQYAQRRVPFGFVDEGPSARTRVTRRDEPWQTISAQVFRGVVERPERLWRQLLDFQEIPLIDPFTLPESAETLVIPTKLIMTGTILNERARLSEL